jgi:hypothetical protein
VELSAVYDANVRLTQQIQELADIIRKLGRVVGVCVT